MNGSNRNLCSPVNPRSHVVPTRAYVGLTVFGLITGLLVLAYALLLLGGYQPAAESPYELLFPEPRERDVGASLFLLLAGGFCIGFTAWSWCRLLNGAREARKKRNQIASLQGELEEKRRPPGYN